MMDKLPPVSHTALSDYENCPRKYYRKYIAKDLPREESEAMRWGNEVHSALEHRLAKKVALPNTMRQYEPFTAAIEQLNPWEAVEFKMGIDAHGLYTDFFSPTVWLRGKADVILRHFDNKVGHIVDWKTGKPREDPAELETFAVLASKAMPAVEKWTGFYVWLASGKVGQLHALDPEKKLAGIRKTVGEMNQRLEANDWPAFENGLCGWCPVKDCPNWRERK